MKENSKKKINPSDPCEVGKFCHRITLAMCAFSAVITVAAYKLNKDYLPCVVITATSGLCSKFYGSKKRINRENKEYVSHRERD